MSDVKRLTARLAATPAEFLAPPSTVAVAAVVSDVLVSAGGRALDEQRATQFGGLGDNLAGLTLVASWLAADTRLHAASADPVGGVVRLLTGSIPPLSTVVTTHAVVHDEDRREELARLALAAFGVVPDGETATQAQDRLATVDSVRRQEVMLAAKAAEERAAAVRAAMAAKQAEEAAARYNQY